MRFIRATIPGNKWLIDWLIEWLSDVRMNSKFRLVVDTEQQYVQFFRTLGTFNLTCWPLTNSSRLTLSMKNLTLYVMNGFNFL